MHKFEIARFYLNVPFAEKEAAKALGAKWCPVKRQWWVHKQVSALPEYGRWKGGDPVMQRQVKSMYQEQRNKKDAAQRRWDARANEVRLTPRKDFSLPDCRCPTTPWEHCQHTRTS